jgi:hypothetical protein
VSDTIHRIELHADSARYRPIESPKASMTVASSYLPGYAVIRLETIPERTVVVEIEALVEALQSASKPRFAMTYCSQCGKDLGPGDHGVSHCRNHD